MHISEGVLSPEVLAAGAALTVIGVGLGLKRMDYDKTPQAAILTAGFFAASFVHIPIGPVSAHLTLNGLLGLMLGWASFPAMLIALTLQAILFSYGGLTSLGVNTFNMALPAVIVYYLFAAGARSNGRFIAAACGFAAGFLAVFLSTVLLGLSLFFTGESFLPAAQTAVVAHLPVMVAEGLLTAVVIGFFKRVKPELLEAVYAPQKV